MRYETPVLATVGSASSIVLGNIMDEEDNPIDPGTFLHPADVGLDE